MINTFKVPQYVKITCTKSHIKGSFEKIGTEYRLQPELLKGEIEHSVIIKSNFADLGLNWESYFRLYMLCLGFIYAGRSMEMQKLGGFGIKNCLTEANLRWKCFGKYIENRELYTSNDKYIRDFLRKSIKGGIVFALK